MTELTEFTYVNNSLTTMAQSRVVSAIASYFKIPQKQMRDGLDKDRLKEDNVLSFTGIDRDIDEFYAVSFKFSVNDLLTPKKFLKSKFLTEYTLFQANREMHDALFTIYPSMTVMTPVKHLNLKGKGVGGILMDYPDQNVDNQVLLTMETFLRITYPSPLSIN